MSRGKRSGLQEMADFWQQVVAQRTQELYEVPPCRKALLSGSFKPLPSASASILIGLVKCWFEHRTAPAWTHQSKPVRAWWSCCGHKECTLQRLQRSRGRIQDLVMFGPKSVVCILRESSCASPMSMRTRRKNCKPSRRSSQKAARGMLKVKQTQGSRLG